MDGPRREVVQRGNEINYFEPGLEPFALNGDYIVDSLPSLIYTDFRNAFLLTTTLSPSGARVLLIVFAGSHSRGCQIILHNYIIVDGHRIKEITDAG